MKSHFTIEVMDQEYFSHGLGLFALARAANYWNTFILYSAILGIASKFLPKT